jgi:hypothetical protein
VVGALREGLFDRWSWRSLRSCLGRLVGVGSWFRLAREEAFGYATLASRSRVEQSLATDISLREE